MPSEPLMDSVELSFPQTAFDCFETTTALAIDVKDNNFLELLQHIPVVSENFCGDISAIKVEADHDWNSKVEIDADSQLDFLIKCNANI